MDGPQSPCHAAVRVSQTTPRARPAAARGPAHHAAARASQSAARAQADLDARTLGATALEPERYEIDLGRRYSLWVFNLGLACCAVEYVAASVRQRDLARLGVAPFAPGPHQADVLVVAGTVTDKMAPAVLRIYAQMSEPRYVISFGACANSGGPYWDSYCVTKGVDQLIPVDVYVPGCPPRPEALLHGIARLNEKIASAEAAT